MLVGFVSKKPQWGLLQLRFLTENQECPLFLKVRDYSGTYTVKLLPCTTPSHQEYRLPVTCNPREPVTFDLDIRFQQVWLIEFFSYVEARFVEVMFTFIGTEKKISSPNFLHADTTRESGGKGARAEGRKKELPLIFCWFSI